MKKISFIISEARLHEQLSIMSLSAALKEKGHDVSLVYFQNNPSNKNHIISSVVNEKPDCVALSFMSGYTNHYISLANDIKNSINTPIIIGGPAATFDENLHNLSTLPFDAVCVGEGDIAIQHYIESLNNSNVEDILCSNFITRAGSKIGQYLLQLVDSLDELPFPDRKIIYDKDDFLSSSKIKMFMSGRGCPYQCTYCFNHKYNKMYKGKGKIIRHKTVDYFLEEIESVKRQYPLEGIIFEDDIFIVNKEWLEEFAQKYPRKIGLPYMCYVRPNLVDYDIGKLLRQSGCYSVRVAVECGNEQLRNKILKRNLTDAQIIKSCDILHREGLKIGTINILGLPTESIENMYETLKINRLCRPDHVSANIFMPLPGVDLTKYAIEVGLLDESCSSPKSSHHQSSMKYTNEISLFLYPFKALFPILVRIETVEKLYNLLGRIPICVLKLFDNCYRLYRNAKFYPQVSFSIKDKFRAFRRFISINSTK